MNNGIYTVKEIASKYKVHYNTVYRWLYSNKLKGLKVNKMWRIKSTDLEAFIEQGARAEQTVSNVKRKEQNLVSP